MTPPNGAFPTDKKPDSATAERDTRAVFRSSIASRLPHLTHVSEPWRTLLTLLCMLAMLVGGGTLVYARWSSLNSEMLQSGVLLSRNGSQSGEAAAARSPKGQRKGTASAQSSAQTRQPLPVSATIQFQRTTSTVAPTTSTISVAVDGSGQVNGQAETASIGAASSVPIPASYTAGLRVVVALSVTNYAKQGATQVSPAGLVLRSATGGYVCTTLGSVALPPTTTATQECLLPPEPVRSDRWSYTNTSTRLAYRGFNKPGGMAPGYIVPAGCGTSAPAVQAAQNALRAQLAAATPAGSRVFFGPVFSISVAGIHCTPGPGIEQPAPFAYVEQLGGTATQSSFRIADVQSFELLSLQAAAGSVTGSALLSTSVCATGPSVLPGATSTKAQVNCPASGLIGWNWDDAALHALAARLAGVTVASAQAILAGMPGIVPSTIHIVTANGAGILPSNAAAIAFNVT